MFTCYTDSHKYFQKVRPKNIYVSQELFYVNDAGGQLFIFYFFKQNARKKNVSE